MEGRFEVGEFNAFNHPNFNNPKATIGTANAGQISGTAGAKPAGRAQNHILRNTCEFAPQLLR